MNYTDKERARYAPETFDGDYLEECFEQLAAWKDFAENRNFETPKDVETELVFLMDNQMSDDQKYDANLVERITFHHDPEVQELWKRICEIVEG